MHQKIYVKQATLSDLPVLTELFDQYRQFYQQPSQPKDCEVFLKENLTLNQSLVFLAINKSTQEGLGFVQLYPTLSSISLRKLFILNDLFVALNARNSGTAQLLIKHCTDVARQKNCRGLTLKTAKTNQAAQNLYQKLGWTKDEKFDSYNLIF